jgi:uncharacterized protein YbcI
MDQSQSNMAQPNMAQPNMAQRVARAAIAFERQRTGHSPASAKVVLSGETLVISLQGALSPAEKALAQTPAGAARVQEFHRQLFANSSDSLREEIARITGARVREATAEVGPDTGSVVAVFTTGTTVQVFLLSPGVASGTWSEGQAVGADESSGPAVGPP